MQKCKFATYNFGSVYFSFFFIVLSVRDEPESKHPSIVFLSKRVFSKNACLYPVSSNFKLELVSSKIQIVLGICAV